MDIGIDLGTTYSVLAIKGEPEFVPGYPPGMYLPECDVSVIPTPDGDTTFPSVFWVDPHGPQEVLVGIAAKQKAEEGHSPIMFSKRSIGTQELLRIHDNAFTAKDVATRILQYLKRCAEQALGQPVHRAVVTHPAYFDLNQVQETREAAVGAGFDMSSPLQMMMEPAAAALAYTLNDERDPLRILTYDLGGGTFDVAVLERRQGVITIKAFDGDHLLGGYNFDRELVQWIIQRIEASGRTIAYDDSNAEHRGRHARLLQLAETIKLKLSEQRTDKVPIPVRFMDMLVDTEGKPVQFIDKISRQQYAALVQEHMDTTIRCCRRALAKAGLEVKELDTIVLVGGSTYAPWVVKRVEDEFGVDVEPYNPDLCIAAGAALQAAELPTLERAGGLTLVLEIPAISPLPTINIAGQVQGADGSRLSPSELSRLRVVLTAPNRTSREPQSLGEEGCFLFNDVALLEDETSALRVAVCEPSGQVFLQKSFEVQYATKGGTATEIQNVLPKPIYLKTGSGMQPVAEGGVPLPARCTIEVQRLHGDPALTVEVYQADSSIGEIRIDNIPEDAGEGCPVEIDVEITATNEMRGEARVRNTMGMLAQTCPVRITFPPVAVADLSELRREFEELEARREQLELLSEDPEQRVLLAGRGDKVVRKLKKLFSEQSPDRQEIQRAIQDLNRLVNAPPDDMKPPRSHFHGLFDACSAELSAEATNPQLQAFRPMLSKIESQANDAFATKNHKTWAQANENLSELYHRIKRIRSSVAAEGGFRDQELPPTPLLKDYFLADIDQLRSAVQSRHEELKARADYATRLKGRLDSILQRVDRIEAEIDKVSDELESKQAFGKLQLAYRSKGRLEKDLELVEFDVMGGGFRTTIPHQTTPAVRQAEAPGVAIDRVHFSVTSPPSVPPGESFVIDVWAHLGRQRKIVMERAKAARSRGEIVIQSKGPVKAARGTVFTVNLAIDDLKVREPEDTILWEGEVGNATFAILVPSGVCPGPKAGVARIYVEEFQVAKLHFSLAVGAASSAATELPVREKRPNRAFASYASEDRDDVLGRIQGMQKVAPNLDVFFDVARLRSGDDWQQRIENEIRIRDILYLFWSRAASRSRWVDWEWRCGIRFHDITFIDPVPLVSPDEVPPPKELADRLHFNDWVLAYKRGRRRR